MSTLAGMLRPHLPKPNWALERKDWPVGQQVQREVTCLVCVRKGHRMRSRNILERSLSSVGVFFGWIVLIGNFPLASAAADSRTFSIDDYFKLTRVTALELSHDGKMTVFVVKRASLKNNSVTKTVYVQSTTSDAAPVRIEDIQDARRIAWIPGEHKVSFLSERGGTTQVYSYNLKTRVIRRHTNSEVEVIDYKFAPNGRSLSFITQEKVYSASLLDQMLTGEKPLLIDPDTFRVQHFTDPNLHSNLRSSTPHLWLKLDERRPVRVEIPGKIEDVYWASDSSKLSVGFVSALGRRAGIYDVRGERFRLLFASEGNDSDTDYETAGWLPGEHRTVVLRARITDVFVSRRHPQWTVVDVAEDHPLAEEDLDWCELSLTGHDAAPLFHLLGDGRVLINKTIGGGYRGLYEVKDACRLEQTDVHVYPEGNISMARFAADGESVVFVHDGLTRPPEIYIWRKRKGANRLTSLNHQLADRRLPLASEVHWKSKDGTAVRGWLLVPPELTRNQNPLPLITFIHGGPSTPMPLGFAEHFWKWPYPFEVCALHGIAVFFPNYRGNTTFGRPFASPARIDGAPVEDIVSGIENLIEEGIADRQRLAISGFSWGAWLGPIVMTRYKEFQAASFAEGAGNFVTVYDLMSGNVNHGVHDDIVGASLYDDPKHYLRLSPALHFRGLRTASLFEAGGQSAAIFMMGYPKAAKYAGMPTKFVIYPQTGHNPSRPRIQMESATRNLDWFRFWLQDYEDPDKEKAEQYSRWRKMRLASETELKH